MTVFWRSDQHGKYGDIRPGKRRAPPIIYTIPRHDQAGGFVVAPQETYTVDSLPCEHRGKALRQEKHELCGCAGRHESIYECALHGECALTRFKKHRRDQPEVCAICYDRHSGANQDGANRRFGLVDIDRAICINLDRRHERWNTFLSTYPSQMPAPSRLSATDGWRVTLPADRTDRGAWGCWESHRRAMASCVESGTEAAIIFEDDAIPTAAFASRWPDFCDALPANWQFVYLGGCIREGLVPRRVNRLVFAPGPVATSHAYAVRQPLLGKILLEMSGAIGAQHFDNFLEGVLPKLAPGTCYCPDRWLFNQVGGMSDISGTNYSAELSWQNAEDVRPIRYVPGTQPCMPDANGVCMRPHCRQTGRSVCLEGPGLVRVEVPEAA